MSASKNINGNGKIQIFLGRDIYQDSKFIECFALVSRLDSIKYRSRYYLKQRDIDNEAQFLKNAEIFDYHDSKDDGDMQYYVSNIAVDKLFSKRFIDALGMKGLECIASTLRNDNCIEYANYDFTDNMMEDEIKILKHKGYVVSAPDECKKRKAQRMISYYKLTAKGQSMLSNDEQNGILSICSENKDFAKYSLEDLAHKGLLLDARNDEKNGLLEIKFCVDETYAPKYHYILSEKGEKSIQKKSSKSTGLEECLKAIGRNNHKIIKVSVKDLARNGMLANAILLEHQKYVQRVNDSAAHDKLSDIKEHYVLTDKGHKLYNKIHETFIEKVKKWSELENKIV